MMLNAITGMLGVAMACWVWIIGIELHMPWYITVLAAITLGAQTPIVIGLLHAYVLAQRKDKP